MAPTNYTINGNLTFFGNVQGTFTLQAQGIAGDLIAQFPSIAPNTGQALVAQSVAGNLITFGWSNIPGSNTPVNLSQLTQGGATTNQVIAWSGTAWVPATSSGGTPAGASGTVQFNNSGAFAGALNSFVSGTGAVVIGNVADGSPVSTTALTVAGSGGIAISLQDWFSSNEGNIIVASMKTSGLLNLNGLHIASSVSIGGTPALTVVGGTAGSPDIADFTTAAGATPSSTKTVWVDFNGGLNFAGALSGSSPAAISLTAATGINIVNSTSGDIDITQSGSGIVLISGPNASSIRLASNGMLLTPGSGQATTIRAPKFSGAVLDNINTGAAHTGQVLAADNPSGNLVWTDAIKVATITEVDSAGVTISGSVGGKGVLVGTGIASDGVALWDNGGSNFLSVSATGGGVSIQTSGGGTVAISGGTLSADSKVKLTSPDTAGVLAMSGSTATYTYGSPYTGVNPPVVVITPLFDPGGNNADFWITNTGTSGAWTAFVLHNSISQTGNVNYIVIDRG